MNYFSRNTLLNTWEFQKKIDYLNTYDTYKRIVKSELFENIKSVAEIKKTRYEYYYNTNGNIIEVDFYQSRIDYFYTTKSEGFSYDNNYNLLTRTNSDHDNGKLYVYFKDDFNYNNLYPFNTLITPIEYISHDFTLPVNINIRYMVTSIKHEQNGNNYTKRYYYSPIIITGIADQESLKTTIFPNPATDYLNINCNTTQSHLRIELYNIAGQKVLNETVYNKSKLSIRDYPKGMYLIKISDNDKIIQTEKVYFK